MWPTHSSTDHSPGSGRTRRQVAGLGDERPDRRRRLGLGDRPDRRRRARRAATRGTPRGSRPGRMVWLMVRPARSVAGRSAESGSRRARSRSAPSPSATRHDQRIAVRPRRRRRRSRRLRPPARTRAAPGAGSPGPPRAPPRRQDRLVEPVGVDRVVDVVHRVELLRPDRERRIARHPPAASPRSTRASPNVAGGAPKTGSNSAGIRVGAPRASSRTQSMWTHATSAPVGVAELGPAARPDAPPADDPGRADQLGPDRDRRDDRDLRRADQPGDAALGVPARPNPRPTSGTRPGPGCSAAGPTSGAARPARLVEADAVRRGAGVRLAARSRAAARPARRASRAVTSPVASCGAVWRASRTSHDRRASNTTSATASRSSSSAACVRASSSWWRTSALMPRAPHLQS